MSNVALPISAKVVADVAADVPDGVAVVVAERPLLDYEAPPEAMRAPADLKSRTIRSSLWTLGGYGSNQIIRFGSNLVLARLLLPYDFGLAALVSMFVNMFQQFSDIGLGPAIIQSRRGDDPRFLNTAWTLGVLRGFALWGCACAIACPVARLYHEPILIALIVVTGFNGVIQGFNSTSLYQLNRHMALGKVTLLTTSAQLITTIVMIAVASMHRSVWAIIAGGMASNVFCLIASHFLIRSFRNRFAWDRAAVRELFKFGGWIFVSTAVTFFANEADRLIFGKLVTVAALGLYNQAATLVRMPMELISRLAHVSLFPALARSAEGERQELARKVRRARSVILPLGVAAVIGLAMGAPMFVYLLYPNKYLDMGWMAQLMAVGLWITILQSSADRTLLAIGHARPLAMTNAVNMVATIAFAFGGYYLGGRYHHAVEGFILGVAVGNLGGHLVIQAALARQGIWIYAQDLEYTLLVIGVGAAGLIGHHLLKAHHPDLNLAWGVLVIGGACLWAGVRALRWMR